MQEHTHTGFIAFVFAGASALIMFNLLKYAAIQLDDWPQTQWIAKVIASTLSFPSNSGAA